MNDHRSFSLAAELRRGLREEFPTISELSCRDPEFVERVLYFAERSRSTSLRSIATRLRNHLDEIKSGDVDNGEAAHHPTTHDPDHLPPSRSTRVYRGRIID